jgi:hypothetical protein
MFSPSVSALRKSLGIVAFELILTGVVVLGQAPGTSPAPSQPASSESPRPANSPTTAVAQQPLPRVDKMEPAETPRGGPVTFVGENFPAKEDDIKVYLNGNYAGIASLVSPDRKSFIFALPSNIALGKYNVRVDIKLKDTAVPFSPTLPTESMLTVYGEAGKTTPKILAISPITGYPDKEIYGFTVVGEGFSKKGVDNGLVIQNQGEIQVCWLDDPECKAKSPQDPKLVYGKVMSDREITFSNIPQKHQGLNGIQIRVGQEYSNTFDITLSRVQRKTPILIALVLFVGLAALLLFIVSRGLVVKEIAGEKYNVLQALLLDKETDTYSLARFQFYVWTAAAILGYLYLMLSRSLVQWKLEFVDVPSGLPGIILISASTAILAQGITNSKGPKGSGEVHPTVADLVTSGGLAVPERLQFFLWTILGAIVFVFLVLASDPGTIKDLPTIPPGFLEIMGVSSLGYLGGKMARKPGPVIDEIVARKGSLLLELHGRNLSKDASFRIGEDEVTLCKIEFAKPTITEPDTESGMAKVLQVRILDPVPTEWEKDDAKLTIINPDGQTASWTYKLTSAPVSTPTADAGVAAAAAVPISAASGTATDETASTAVVDVPVEVADETGAVSVSDEIEGEGELATG